jgi:hypothetical protein
VKIIEASKAGMEAAPSGGSVAADGAIPAGTSVRL